MSKYRLGNWEKCFYENLAENNNCQNMLVLQLTQMRKSSESWETQEYRNSEEEKNVFKTHELMSVNP